MIMCIVIFTIHQFSFNITTKLVYYLGSGNFNKDLFLQYTGIEVINAMWNNLDSKYFNYDSMY